MSTTQTTGIGYVDYDFPALVTNLQSLLQQQPAWLDMYRSSTGQTLLELFAAVGNLVLYYIERRAEESYITTAQNYSSVVNLARLLNYIPTRNISSVGPLQFTVSSPAPSLITIPQWTSISSNSGVNFLVLDTAANIAQNGTTANCHGIQGNLITVSYVSNGSSTQTYNIKDTSIENSVTLELLGEVTSLSIAQAIQAQVQSPIPPILNPNGTYSVYAYNNSKRQPTFFVSVQSSSGTVGWNQQSSFINSTNTSTDFVLRPELDGSLTVVFGNGVFGAFPQLGQTIIVQYVQSAGLAGNIFGTGLINTINSTIFYAGTTTPVTNISVTNTDNFLGGANAETINEIRTNAPAVFSTGDRAVTKADFIALIKEYAPGCNVVVYGENDINPPNYNMYNQVLICMIIPTGNQTPNTPNINAWESPSPTYETNLAAYLYSKSLITVRYSFVAPTIVLVVPELTVRVSQTASTSTVTGLVEAAVQNEFILGETTSLGQNIYQSDIISAVEAVPGVLHCHATLKLMKPLTYGYISNYTWATNADLLPVLTNNVELWVGTSQIAYDNGSGGWTNIAGSGYTVSGLVEYASVNTTSTSSVAIGFGSESFLVGMRLAIAYGTTVTITYNNSNWMSGFVTSYAPITGNLVVTITSITGSGTYSSWAIVDNTALIGVNFTSGTLPTGSTPFIKYQQNNSAVTPNSVGDLVVGQTQIIQWSSTLFDYIGY